MGSALGALEMYFRFPEALGTTSGAALDAFWHAFERFRLNGGFGLYGGIWRCSCARSSLLLCWSARHCDVEKVVKERMRMVLKRMGEKWN